MQKYKKCAKSIMDSEYVLWTVNMYYGHTKFIAL